MQNIAQNGVFSQINELNQKKNNFNENEKQQKYHKKKITKKVYLVDSVRIFYSFINNFFCSFEIS